MFDRPMSAAKALIGQQPAINAASTNARDAVPLGHLRSEVASGNQKDF
jgi:hypothetical protein